MRINFETDSGLIWKHVIIVLSLVMLYILIDFTLANLNDDNRKSKFYTLLKILNILYMAAILFLLFFYPGNSNSEITGLFLIEFYSLIKEHSGNDTINKIYKKIGRILLSKLNKLSKLFVFMLKNFKAVNKFFSKINNN